MNVRTESIKMDDAREAEYIERENIYPLAKKIVDEIVSGNYHPGVFGLDILDWIDDLPAADVRPIVLCRDCKRYCGRPWENNKSGICARTDVGVGEDDFCSYGEKLEER